MNRRDVITLLGGRGGVAARGAGAAAGDAGRSGSSTAVRLTRTGTVCARTAEA